MANALIAVLVLGSAVSMPLVRIWGISLTGDRMVGLIAVALVLVYMCRGRIRWTRIHLALALFVGVQLFTTLLNAWRWPRGLQLVTVYILGFACFALTAHVAAREEARRFAAQLLIAVGAVVGLVAGLLGVAANLWDTQLWGTVRLPVGTPADPPVFSAYVTFLEANFLGSFLLIPLSLSLWSSRSDGPRPLGIVTGIAFSYTRAAWLGMAGILAAWAWRRRPPMKTVVSLLGAIALIFAIQIATTGPGVFLQRTMTPVLTGFDKTVAPRAHTNRTMLRSWRNRPLVGHGAGAGSRIGARRGRAGHWAGNLEVHLLQNSGLLGLASFLLVVVVVWRSVRAARHRRDEGWITRGVPLAATGVCLLFAYQFTQALWVMYPYVYLGLLTAELHGSEQTP
jgi:MYXO-CTERM domain-containing protein